MTYFDPSVAQPVVTHHPTRPTDTTIAVRGDMSGVDLVPELRQHGTDLQLAATPAGLALLRRMLEQAESCLPLSPRRGLMRFER